MRADVQRTQELILSLLEKHYILPRQEIIEQLHAKNNLGKSTIVRHIDKLAKQTPPAILKIKHKDYDRYHISSTNNKEVYCTLATNTDKAEYYDTIITSLASPDPIKRSNALIEIESLQSIRLNPEQLNKLSELLRKADGNEADLILKILYDNFMQQRFPKNLGQFRSNLRNYIQEHKQEKGNNRRQTIMRMLAILSDPTVLEQFKKDISNANNEEISRIQTDYSGWMFIKIFEQNRKVLLEFTNTLQDEKKRLAIFTVRKSYHNKIESYNEKMKPFATLLKEVQE